MRPRYQRGALLRFAMLRPLMTRFHHSQGMPGPKRQVHRETPGAQHLRSPRIRRRGEQALKPTLARQPRCDQERKHRTYGALYPIFR